MPNADLTNKNLRLPNINEATQFVKTDVYKVNIAGDGLTSAGTHILAVIPKGRMVTAMRAAVLTATAGSIDSTKTLTVKAGVKPYGGSFGGVLTLVSSSSSAVVAKGQVFGAAANGVDGYACSDSGDATICLEVANGSLSAGVFLLAVDTAPVDEYLTNG